MLMQMEKISSVLIFVYFFLYRVFSYTHSVTIFSRSVDVISVYGYIILESNY